MTTIPSKLELTGGRTEVNADDAALRANRLNVLSAIRSTMDQVADFSKIEG